MVIENKVSAPGVFMYHCASGAVTDQHIKMGMYGVTIVYHFRVPRHGRDPRQSL
jgi:hypothetical protein